MKSVLYESGPVGRFIEGWCFWNRRHILRIDVLCNNFDMPKDAAAVEFRLLTARTKWSVPVKVYDDYWSFRVFEDREFARDSELVAINPLVSIQGYMDGKVYQLFMEVDYFDGCTPADIDSTIMAMPQSRFVDVHRTIEELNKCRLLFTQAFTTEAFLDAYR